MVLRAGSLGSVATPPAVSAARGHLSYVVQTIRLSRETSARHGAASARRWSRYAAVNSLTDPRHHRALGLIARLLEKLAPGDPYSRPWDNLASYGPVATERFPLGLYYVCTVEKAAEQ